MDKKPKLGPEWERAGEVVRLAILRAKCESFRYSGFAKIVNPTMEGQLKALPPHTFKEVRRKKK